MKKKINYPYLPNGKEIKYVGLDNEFMQAAKKASDDGACRKQSTGAVLVKNGKILASGTNAKITVDYCPRVKAGLKTGGDYSLCKSVCGQEGHAEELAVKNAKRLGLDTKGADIYLYGHWWCCENCWGTMNEGEINNVFLLNDSEELFNYSSKIQKIYISGALNADKDGKLRKVYEKIAKLCKTICTYVYVPHLEGTDPVKNPKVTPEEVWLKDFTEVSNADLTIAYIGALSIGVGAEIEWARENKKDIIIWWFKGDMPSRLPKGNPAVKYSIEATDEKDLLQQLKTTLAFYR